MSASWASALVIGTMGGVVASASVAFAQPAPRPSPVSQVQEYKTSIEEYEALKRKAHGGVKHTPLTLPDWKGIWRRDNPADQSDREMALTPKYRADYERKRANIAKGVEWDRLSWCLPAGMPRWLFDPFVREFIPTPDEMWLLYEQQQEIRRVYTDGRGHVDESVAIPLWEGDSIGFWDGDTLVVHTNHLKAGEYWRGSPEVSFNASTVERWRKVGPGSITVDLTVYDPDSLTRPWHAKLTYVKLNDPGIRVSYASCEEGNNAVQTPEGGTTYVLPGEPGYREPTTFGIPGVALDSLPN